MKYTNKLEEYSSKYKAILCLIDELEARIDDCEEKEEYDSIKKQIESLYRQKNDMIDSFAKETFGFFVDKGIKVKQPGKLFSQKFVDVYGENYSKLSLSQKKELISIVIGNSPIKVL